MCDYGPSLPPRLQKKRHEDSDSEDGKDADEVPLGPALPPHLRKSNNERLSKAEKNPIEEEDDDDDDDVIGPMPPLPGQSASSSAAAADFERRAHQMKDKLEGRLRPQEPQRESWMTELPPESSKNFGLGPRQFNRSNKAEKVKDRSMWSDTPEMKAKRARGEVVDQEQDHSQDKDVLEYMASLERDKEMERVSKELKSKRGSDSLMDMHSKKLKKDRESEDKAGVSKERRPFDRDVDLQANRFDNAQKEMMLKRARQLDSKFSAGAQKFL